MKFKIAGKERDLKFTFNSFRHMEDLDFEKLEESERKPFIVAGFVATMTLGALNHKSKGKVFTEDEVNDALEDFLENDGNIMELFEYLFELLQESNFFKKLQGKEVVSE